MNIGIIIPHLQTSQLAHYVIQNSNGLTTTNNQYNVVLFHEQLTVPCYPLMVSTMSVNEIWGFKGILISTTIDNTILLGRAIGEAQKFFYVWDLEWLRPNKNNFLHNMQAFRNPNISLIARNKDHAHIINNYCNRQVSIILPNFNLQSLIQTISEKSHGQSKRSTNN